MNAIRQLNTKASIFAVNFIQFFVSVLGYKRKLNVKKIM